MNTNKKKGRRKEGTGASTASSFAAGLLPSSDDAVAVNASALSPPSLPGDPSSCGRWDPADSQLGAATKAPPSPSGIGTARAAAAGKKPSARRRPHPEVVPAAEPAPPGPAGGDVDWLHRNHPGTWPLPDDGRLLLSPGGARSGTEVAAGVDAAVSLRGPSARDRPAPLASPGAVAAAAAFETNEDSDAAADAGGVAIVSARLVEDFDVESPGEGSAPEALVSATAPPPLAVATKQGAVSVDLEDRRVRACLGLTAAVAVGAIVGGAVAGTRARTMGADGGAGAASVPPEAPSAWRPTQPPVDEPAAAAPSAPPTVLDWIPAGPALYGEDYSRFGWSVALSTDGSRLAVAAPSDPAILKTLESIGAAEGATGTVSVCDLLPRDGNGGGGNGPAEEREWTCEDVPAPPLAEDVLATLVSLAGDGNRLAVGYPRTSHFAGNSTSRGFVQAYWYDPSRREGLRWLELGPAIYGDADDARWGGTYQWFDDGDSVAYEEELHEYQTHRDVAAQPVTSLSLSSDGTTVAIGSPVSAAGGLPEVHLYRYRDEAGAWEHLGKPLTGRTEKSLFGQSVSLSADGGTVAVGAPNHLMGDAEEDEKWHRVGAVAVYRYDDSAGEWAKIGQNLEGLAISEPYDDANVAFQGDSVSLSGYGAVVATVATYRDSNDYCEGLVKVHEYSEERDEWTQRGQLLWQNGGFENITSCDDIPETDENDSGYALSLSADASRLAVGISGSDIKSSDAGAIYVFDYDGSSWIQKGSVVLGRDEGVRAGWSVALSADGSRLAVGSPLDKDSGSNTEGRVQVYEVGGKAAVPLPPVTSCSQGEIEVEFHLVTDVFGDETSWRILNRTLSVVINGGPYKEGFIQTENVRMCLPLDCYKFSIFDSFANGIGKRGGYSLRVDGKHVQIGELRNKKDVIIGNCTDAADMAFPDFCFNVNEPEKVGNGVCDSEYNKKECGYDSGDCTSFNSKWPGCVTQTPAKIGDGICDGGAYNTAECGFDGGDCDEFNRKWPNCAVEGPVSRIGDGECDVGEYNTEECGFDGGDCIEFNSRWPGCIVNYPARLGDGECDGDEYNTEVCGFDGGDCLAFNQAYPNCIVYYFRSVGDGVCDGGEYNTEECGWDGGDCDEFNNKWPNCAAFLPAKIGDEVCDGGEYNVEECGFDGGDCFKYNEEFPNCKARDPSKIRDGHCDAEIEYNTEECGFDGGDCDDFNNQWPGCYVYRSEAVGDGECDGDPYNTEECGFDGGDCSEFNSKWPSCVVYSPQNVGDGECNGDEYNTEECGFGGGDCLEFNRKWPGCVVWNPSAVGDGECDGGGYDTEECGFDGGDCIRLDFGSKWPDCDIEDPAMLGNGECNDGSYNTEECGFDGFDCLL